MIILSQKIRIYPTDEDIENFKKYIGYKRYLYNKAIVVQKELWLRYKEEKAKYENFDLLDDKEKKIFYSKYYPHMSLVRDNMVRTKEKWEYNYASKLIESVATDVVKAIKNALNPKMPNHKMPKFKKKKNQKITFSFEGIRISKNNELLIPKATTSQLTGIKPSNPIIFSKIRMGEKLRFSGKITGSTVNCNRNGKWFVSFTVKLDEESERKYRSRFDKDRNNKPECGIDANIRGFRYNKVEGGYEDWATINKELLNQYRLIKHYSRVLSKKRLSNKDWKRSKTYAKMRVILKHTIFKRKLLINSSNI